MDSLNGVLKENNKLSGFLSTVEGAQLTGGLVTAQTLKGQLVSNESNMLSGSLHTAAASLSGDISIPFEIPTDPYEGEYTVASKPFKSKTIPTQGLKMLHDIVVLEIPYYKTGNESGYTVYIGGE